MWPSGLVSYIVFKLLLSLEFVTYNQHWAWHHENLKLELKLKYLNILVKCFMKKSKVLVNSLKIWKKKMTNEPISSSFMTLQQGEITVSVTKQVGRISWSVICHSHAIIMSMYKLFKSCVCYIFASLFCKPKGDHL